MKSFKKIKETLEEKGVKYVIRPKEGYGLVEFWTDTAGQDIPTEFDFDGTPEGFVKEFVERAKSYDVDTEVELFAGMRGKEGVPDTIRELINDCQEAKDTLLDIAKALKKDGAEMITEFGAAFIQKPLDEGLKKGEVSDLFDMLKGISAIPFEVQSENAVAMGFVNRTDAELMDYDLKPLAAFVREIISDTKKENETGQYEFHYDGAGIIDVYIGYEEVSA